MSSKKFAASFLNSPRFCTDHHSAIDELWILEQDTRAMKKCLLIVFLLCGAALAQVQVVPPQVLNAKTAIADVYWPDGNPADVREVKYEADHFLKKWKRFELVRDFSQADIVVFVVVEPMTVYPGFWQRLAYIQNAQQFGAAAAAPLLEPSTVLTGSILIYDGADIKKMLADKNAPRPAPIMFQEGEGNRYKPLLTAGKKLRKLIDAASATASASPPAASH